MVTAEQSNERRFVAFLRRSDGLRGNMALSYQFAAPPRRWRPCARTRANSGEPTAHVELRPVGAADLTVNLGSRVEAFQGSSEWRAVSLQRAGAAVNQKRTARRRH